MGTPNPPSEPRGWFPLRGVGVPDTSLAQRSFCRSREPRSAAWPRRTRAEEDALRGRPRWKRIRAEERCRVRFSLRFLGKAAMVRRIRGPNPPVIIILFGSFWFGSGPPWVQGRVQGFDGFGLDPGRGPEDPELPFLGRLVEGRYVDLHNYIPDTTHGTAISSYRVVVWGVNGRHIVHRVYGYSTFGPNQHVPPKPFVRCLTPHDTLSKRLLDTLEGPGTLSAAQAQKSCGNSSRSPARSYRETRDRGFTDG